VCVCVRVCACVRACVRTCASGVGVGGGGLLSFRKIPKPKHKYLNYILFQV